jgi:dihydrofolate reductase
MEQTCEVVVCRSWPEVEKAIHRELETFVIGGSEVFLSAIPWANKIYRTVVKVECAGDAHFPELAKCWEVVEQMAISQGEGDQYTSTFQILRRFAD